MTEEKIFKKREGHNSAYASFLLIGVKFKELLHCLNTLIPDVIEDEDAICNCECRDGAISFEVCGVRPDIIHKMTEKLSCTGFADTGAWQGAACFVASKNGKEYEGYSAEWTDGAPDRRDWDYEDASNIPDEEIEWDAFVTVKDDHSGEVFHTGDGCITYDEMKKWQAMINEHPAAKQIKDDCIDAVEYADTVLESDKESEEKG